MKLIAESGGTKTQWCGISGTNETGIISTTGLNPNFVSGMMIKEVISSRVLPEIGTRKIEEVWFYGAGCSGELMETKVRDAVAEVLPAAVIHVFSDLTGAARSLLGKKAGYLCMIGTGSNSGYFDGNMIVSNVPPLGFILGDEGSGASLGKKLLADHLRGIMPADLSHDFMEKYVAEKEEVVSHVYRGEFPSKYIGDFVRFLKDHISEDYCRNLITSSFEEFADRNLRLYHTTGLTEIAVTGSVAWYFRDLLRSVLKKHDFVISAITKEPVKGLINFHKTNY